MDSSTHTDGRGIIKVPCMTSHHWQGIVQSRLKIWNKSPLLLAVCFMHMHTHHMRIGCGSNGGWSPRVHERLTRWVDLEYKNTKSWPQLENQRMKEVRELFPQRLVSSSIHFQLHKGVGINSLVNWFQVESSFQSWRKPLQWCWRVECRRREWTDTRRYHPRPQRPSYREASVRGNQRGWRVRSSDTRYTRHSTQKSHIPNHRLETDEWPSAGMVGGDGSVGEGAGGKDGGHGG